MNYQTILVPLDGSPRAEKILPHVEELARKFAADLVLLQVIEPSEVGKSTRDAGSIYVVNLLKERIHQTRAYLVDLQDQLQMKRVCALVRVEHGPIVSKILEVAAREKADLIAIASHGRTGLAQVFYGSVAAGLLQQTDRPLLLIRAEG
jgi:nucleotide-binding universal stress UspA family protein